MLIKHRANKPVIDSSAYVAPNAVIVGQVQVGPQTRIMYGAVLDSEGSKIEVGKCSIVCENSVVRATASGNKEYPVKIDDNVFIGPQSTLLGCSIESGSYLATGVTILQGAKINSGSVVAVGALVHVKTVIPKDYFVPPNTVAIGNPVRLYGPDEKEEMAKVIMSIGFAKVAFNIDVSGKSRADIYKEATEIRSKEFGQHADDEILNKNQ